MGLPALRSTMVWCLGLPVKQQQRRKLRRRGSRSSSGSERPRTDPPGQPRTLGRHGFQRAPGSLSWETLSLLRVPLGKQGAEVGGKKPGFGLCRVTVTRAPETLSPPTLGVCICETEITVSAEDDLKPSKGHTAGQEGPRACPGALAALPSKIPLALLCGLGLFFPLLLKCWGSRPLSTHSSLLPRKSVVSPNLTSRPQRFPDVLQPPTFFSLPCCRVEVT